MRTFKFETIGDIIIMNYSEEYFSIGLKEGIQMNTYYLAIDIGASSGRHILGCVENGRLNL